MKDRILQTLKDLRAYALKKGYEITLAYHEEDSYLMRFANSAISLNTNEHLIRLGITAYEGRKRASYDLITDLDKLDEMKKGVDIAAEMVAEVEPARARRLAQAGEVLRFARSVEKEDVLGGKADFDDAGLGIQRGIASVSTTDGHGEATGGC